MEQYKFMYTLHPASPNINVIVLWYDYQNQAYCMFCKACELRTDFTLLNGCKRKKSEECATETLCGPQTLNYLLYGT